MQSLAFDYHDTLEQLNENVSLAEKIHAVHRVIRERIGGIERIAAALYDPKTDLIKTFVDSTGGDDRLLHYRQARLAESPSLQEILQSGHPRVLNDLAGQAGPASQFADTLARLGYASSYTMPMYHGGAFFGFLFFDSRLAGHFTPERLHALDVFGHLIALVIIHDLSRFRTLVCAVKAARNLTHHRDMETGAHLDRMAYYARLIARTLAQRYDLSDDFVEKVFLFAPLHDVGKIGLPDSILRKPGNLTPEEYEVVKTHTVRGREIVDTLVADFDLTDLEDVDLLRNIATHHHEALNGSGYPMGLTGGEIPLEARIIAVADVFDALTSRRPYKSAWNNKEAFAFLRQLAGIKLDLACVEALLSHPAEIEQIQKQFSEDSIG